MVSHNCTYVIIAHSYTSSVILYNSCSSLRRQSGQLDLPLRMSNPRTSGGRYEPYSTRASRAKELATPGSLNLMNQPALLANKLSQQRALPRYAAPLSSPGLMPALSPTVHGKGITSSLASSLGMSLPLPSINLSSGPTTTSSSGAVMLMCVQIALFTVLVYNVCYYWACTCGWNICMYTSGSWLITYYSLCKLNMYDNISVLFIRRTFLGYNFTQGH